MDPVREYYDGLGQREWDRLDSPSGALEFDVNTSLIARYLSPASRVLDIGGGPGRYAIWLADRGHDVVLGDLSKVLLDVARSECESVSGPGVVRDIVEADARDLSRWRDGTFDAALCLGPFYHLPLEEDRRSAAGELRRVVRSGGVVFVAFMPWQALFRRTLAIPRERHRLMDSSWLARLRELGQFENDVPGRFDHGFGVRPNRIIPFLEEQGFEAIGLYASEGLGAGVEDALAQLRGTSPTEYWTVLQQIIESADDPTLLGLTTHIMYVGRVR